MSKEYLEALEDFKMIKFKTINAGYNYGYKVWDKIEQALLKAQEQEKENELLKEIIKILFDRGCPLHLYNDKKLGPTIEVDSECSIINLGEFKGVDLNEKLKEVLEDGQNNRETR